MHTDLNKTVKSSFLSCEKDAQLILKKLFVENPQKKELMKLLVINTKDCLDNLDYNTVISEYNLTRLYREGYVALKPKLKFAEHQEIQSQIIISFDNFIQNSTNPEFRDCTVSFDIICPTDQWDIGDQRLRPLKIAGYIDGVLNQARLTGIGTFQFIGCNELIFDETLSGYTLTYMAVHGEDDKIPDA